MSIYIVNKKLADTPLLCLEMVRQEKGIDKNVPMTYAGRLDPAATGEIIILSGEDVHKKDDYTKCDKIYTVRMLVGFTTDTGDLLGKLTHKIDVKNTINSINKKEIEIAIEKLKGERPQNFHKFSSKIVDGKPMWLHSKEDNNVNASHIINIYSIDLIDFNEMPFKDVYDRVMYLCSHVKGDFRQDEIIDSWKNINTDEYPVPYFDIVVKCSSGTYMRVLAEEIMEQIGIPVCIYSIHRDKIILKHGL